MDLEYNQIYESLRALVPQGAVFELRLLGERKGHIDSGYFDDPAQAANALVSTRDYYKGVYFTPNPVNREAQARAYNRIQPWAKHTTFDAEITRRRWLLIDIDPRRMSGISSNEEEHQAALKKANEIVATLGLLYGFPDPTITDSGNGAHIMYRIDEPNTDEVRDTMHDFLRILKAQHDSEHIDMDVTVYNAARIWRVPGTWARKGDSTPERPHRRASILRQADPFKVLELSRVMRYNADHAALLDKSKLPSSGNKNALDYPQDEALYKRLNEYAMRNLKQWVPTFFPSAREYKEGYRIASEDIGQPYEEELTIHPWPLGIKYFGVADQGDGAEGRRTPVSVIAQYSLQTSDKALAARKLSDTLNYPITELGPLSAPQHLTLNGSASPSMSQLLGTKPAINFKSVRSVADLRTKQFKEIKWVIDGVLPTGNMMLAARPKMRKTWLALQLGLAIARGRKFLDWQCNQGDVLFLGLEDNDRRLRSRIDILTRFEIDVGDLTGFRYWTGGMNYNAQGRLVVTDPQQQADTLKVFPRGQEGCDALDQFLDQYPKTTTIIIDTLAHFRGPRMSRDVYQEDYESMMPLTKIAAKRNILIIPVHHEKKGNADRERGGDFLEDVSGSAGITGGSDGVISIKGRRGTQVENESRKLLISGRDVPHDFEIDIAFEAETGGWRKAIKEDVKVAIRGWLSRMPFINQRDLYNLIPHVGQARLYRALSEMRLDGEIEQGRYGYSLRKP